MNEEGDIISGPLEEIREVPPSSHVYGKITYSNGILVKTKNRWGVVSKFGEWILSPRFLDSTGISVDGFALLFDGNLWFQFDFGKQELHKTGLSGFQKIHTPYKGVVPVKANGKWGLANLKGELLIPANFDLIDSYFSEGLVICTRNNKSVFLNTKGEEDFGLTFDNAMPFSEGFAAVKFEGSWGYISPNGKWLLEPQFNRAGSFLDGLTVVRKGNCWYWLTRECFLLPQKFIGE